MIFQFFYQRDVYGNKLGCTTDVLYLINEKLGEIEIKEKIL
jgi:DNA-dependent RNA polymerase auxiliary subunit epsilon